MRIGEVQWGGLRREPTGMDDVHRAHRATGVVEYPLLLGAQVLGTDLFL